MLKVRNVVPTKAMFLTMLVISLYIHHLRKYKAIKIFYFVLFEIISCLLQPVLII